MTREEFITRTIEEEWDEDYVTCILQTIDNAAKKGIKIPYCALLPPGPGVEV